MHMETGIDFNSNYDGIYDEITDGNMCLHISATEKARCESDIGGLSKQGVFALLIYIHDYLQVEYETLSQLETRYSLPSRKYYFLLTYFQSKHQKIGIYIYIYSTYA